jgi:hypothetical protein
MPISARISFTLRQSGAVSVEPHSRLMLKPSHGDHLGAQLPQGLRRNLISRAVGAIDHHAQAIERQVARQRSLGELDVAALSVVDAPGATEIRALRQLLDELGIDQLFDLEFDLVRQLESVGSEQLDAVVVIRVVGGGDHHAEIGAHGTREHRDGRRRHRAGLKYIHADRGEAGHQRGFDHVAGEAGILADQHAVTMIAATEGQPGRLPDLERQFRGDCAVGAAADTIGTEIFSIHVPQTREG